MKYLSIFRHAKAERTEDFAIDFERPLTPRGQKDSHHMGEILAGLEPPIDWIVSSPSQRTRETTDILTKTLKFEREAVWQDAIYEADAETLLTLLAQVPAEMEHLLIVGHNPGMEELVSGLAAGAPTRLGITMPTAGLAHLTLEIFGWNQIRWGSGTLHLLLRPKSVRAR
ncbi:MAG: histidine phosphatase family protein [Caldilineaceae bacterium]|nr:histidine phosphatase family protein [Caldilineaceae bacterium]